MDGWRVRGLDLTSQTAALLHRDPAGSLFLGCTFDAAALEHLLDWWRARVPRRAGRAGRRVPRRRCTPPTSSTPASAQTATPATPDARAYAWSQRRSADTADIVARALHDAAIEAALDAEAGGVDAPVVGVMGGHGVARGERRLPPGGAARAAAGRRPDGRRHRWWARGDGGGQPRCLPRRRRRRRPRRRARPARRRAVVQAVGRRLGPRRARRARTVAGRRWRARRADLVLRPRAAEPVRRRDRQVLPELGARGDVAQPVHGGIVFLPGAAGTVQEIFQDACENYYAAARPASPRWCSSAAATGPRRCRRGRCCRRWRPTGGFASLDRPGRRRRRGGGLRRGAAAAAP